MLAEDFSRFESVIRKLEGIYGKSIDDGTMQAWWGALRDMPFEQVRERVDSHIRYSKFFPKPVDIRPKEERPKESHDDYAFREASARSDRNLDLLWEHDCARWLETVSPKVYEIGRAKGMTDGMIAEKLSNYRPRRMP